MKISCLQLKSYYFPVITIISNREKSPETKHSPETSCFSWPYEYLIIDKSIIHSGDPDSYGVNLVIESGDQQVMPYRFLLQCVGEFTVDATYEGDKTSLVAINAASVLYSACRELLLDQTAKTPNGRITLPTVAFDAPVNERVHPKGLNSLAIINDPEKQL